MSKETGSRRLTTTSEVTSVRTAISAAQTGLPGGRPSEVVRVRKPKEVAPKPAKETDGVPHALWEANRIGDEFYSNTVIATNIRVGDAAFGLMRDGELTWDEFADSKFSDAQTATLAPRIATLHRAFGIPLIPAGIDRRPGEREIPLDAVPGSYHAAKFNVRAAVEVLSGGQPAAEYLADAGHMEATADMFAAAARVLDTSPARQAEKAHRQRLNFRVQGIPSRPANAEDKALITAAISPAVTEALSTVGEAHGFPQTQVLAFRDRIMEPDFVGML